MSTNTCDDNQYGENPNTMLNYRKLRLSVYMVILLCAAVPSCILYGNAIDNDQCGDCNASATGWYILLLSIIISGIFMWLIPNSNIMDNKIAKIIFGILFLIASIMIFAGVMLTYDEECSDTDDDSNCLSYVGEEWFVISHCLLLAIDIMSDYGSEISKRLLSYSIMYAIGCCILFKPFFEDDNPTKDLELTRAGICCIPMIIYIIALHIYFLLHVITYFVFLL